MQLRIVTATYLCLSQLNPLLPLLVPSPKRGKNNRMEKIEGRDIEERKGEKGMEKRGRMPKRSGPLS